MEIYYIQELWNDIWRLHVYVGKHNNLSDIEIMVLCFTKIIIKKLSKIFSKVEIY